MKKKKINSRLLNKWHKLAYLLENDGRRVRQIDESAADAILAIASQLGNLVRSLEYQE